MPPSWMSPPARYFDIDLHWFTIHISAANLIVILTMIVVFILALLAPYRGEREGKS